VLLVGDLIILSSLLIYLPRSTRRMSLQPRLLVVGSIFVTISPRDNHPRFGDSLPRLYYPGSLLYLGSMLPRSHEPLERDLGVHLHTFFPRQSFRTDRSPLAADVHIRTDTPQGGPSSPRHLLTRCRHLLKPTSGLVPNSLPSRSRSPRITWSIKRTTTSK
jgi:hypothetical protein